MAIRGAHTLRVRIVSNCQVSDTSERLDVTQTTTIEPTPASKSLLSRLIGVLTGPRAAYADVAARPRWIGLHGAPKRTWLRSWRRSIRRPGGDSTAGSASSGRCSRGRRAVAAWRGGVDGKFMVSDT